LATKQKSLGLRCVLNEKEEEKEKEEEEEDQLKGG